MKDNFLDNVVDGVKERVGLAQDRIHTDFKRTRKFRQEPVPAEQQIMEYESLGVPGIMALVSKYGSEPVNQYVFEMEQLKQKRARYAR